MLDDRSIPRNLIVLWSFLVISFCVGIAEGFNGLTAVTTYAIIPGIFAWLLFMLWNRVRDRCIFIAFISIAVNALFGLLGRIALYTYDAELSHEETFRNEFHTFLTSIAYYGFMTTQFVATISLVLVTTRFNKLLLTLGGDQSNRAEST